ncbi:protein of unknown function [Kyrpidia spormannii]|uniref:Uncharacterized protein n=1 Tax=Kyrpidia spormannii TaxID=2055160 RepID=A0ACA8ZCP0_9BACL|nr:protein of unknown function [Kyrpidia spormannii]
MRAVANVTLVRSVPMRNGNTVDTAQTNVEALPVRSVPMRNGNRSPQIHFHARISRS